MRKAFVRLLIPALGLTAACDGDPVTIPATLTLTGTVFEQGAPSTVVAGADVRFAVPAEGEDPDWVETTTDAEGRYDLQLEAPAGCAATDSAEVRYEAEAAGYSPFTSMTRSLSQKVSCGSAPQTFDIAMQPEA